MNNELCSSIFYNDEIEIYKYISISEHNYVSVTPLQHNIIFLPQCVGGWGCFQALKKKKTEVA